MKQGWYSESIEDLCEVEYGTRVVRKRDAGTIYLVYGGGGATFSMDTYNREDRMVIARFAMSKRCARFVDGKFFLNDSGLTISPLDDNTFDQDFLNYQILSLNDEIYSLARGTAQKNLNVNAFKKVQLSYPTSLEEQKQIVAKLDQCFEAIDKAKANAAKNLENAKELFQSKLNDIFSQKGEGWVEKKLGDVCSLIKRGIPPKYIETGGIQVVNQKCIRNHKVNLTLARRHNIVLKSVSQEKLIQIGDVLVNSTGVGTLGRVAQVRDSIISDTTVDTHVTIVRPIPDLFFIDFFGYVLIKIEDEITKSGEGASGQTELARTKLQNNFIVSYPTSLEEQKQIVKILDSLKKQTQSLESKYQQELNSLEELKKSILQKAFEGEL